MKWGGKKKRCGGGEIQGEKCLQSSRHHGLSKLFVATSNSAFCLHFTKTLCTAPYSHPPNNSSPGISPQVSNLGTTPIFCSLQWHLFSVYLLGVLPSATLLFTFILGISQTTYQTMMEWISNLVRDPRIILDSVWFLLLLSFKSPTLLYNISVICLLAASALRWWHQHPLWFPCLQSCLPPFHLLNYR